MSEPPPLPASLRAFLDEEIFSVPQLEVLLLVHSAEGEVRTPEQLAAGFYLPPAAFTPWLHAFVARGLLLADEDGFRAPPAADPAAVAVRELAEWYGRRRVTVTRHVYGSREDPARRFADAFRLRKEKDR